MKIYVASNWRNTYQQRVVADLRESGHDVYDFRNPPHGRGGFAWSDIDPQWQQWTPEQFIQALKHNIAREGYESDRAGMDWADACVCVLPCGRSAHLEAGFMAGQGKPVIVYQPVACEPELMYLLTSTVCCSFHDLVSLLDDMERLVEEIPANG